ncbi:MAG: Sensor protein PhoQ (EC [uncultured Thiotrichaceae bacterium]|uniref:histidine kinase n=1 Tax=uncultured Thiotrichaceae bacterium TaxID=298394 RepID=A0A6S6T9K7_9GAMM|nr:MAG: Sensor protein PhoQ (EC [uncultured Thiotrichaceae bacterium]
MMGSLRSRQLVSGFTIIVVGILVLGILLSMNIYHRKTDAIIDDLESTSYNLLGYIEFNVEPKGGTFTIGEGNRDEASIFISARQLAQSNKERFAYIWGVDEQNIVWSTSESRNPEDFALFDFKEIAARPKTNSFTPEAKSMQSVPQANADEGPAPYMVAAQTFSFNLNAESKTDKKSDYIFVVAASTKEVGREISDLIMVFAILFFVSVILILIAQLASSFWVVHPIREFEEEVRDIENGNKGLISNEYPDELVPIKNTINALIGHEKGQKQRYKDALDDLAHSLKTPLAAIQAHIGSDNFHDIPANHPGLAGIASEMEYMQEIISRQLRKAMVTTDNAIIMAQPIRPLLIRLAATMKKVHRGKEFEIRINVDEYSKCRLDNEDLMELFGNLLNNACKFCDKLVEISSYRDNDMLVIDIDDDGMGFPSENPSKLLKRGIREDSKTEGQGIGLAVSTEIIAAVNGRIELLVSPYVGARVRLHLPV